MFKVRTNMFVDDAQQFENPYEAFGVYVRVCKGVRNWNLAKVYLYENDLLISQYSYQPIDAYTGKPK